MNWSVVVVLACAAMLVVLVGIWSIQTARRLDRLHVRSDQSWLALDAALARRSVVARAVAGAVSALDSTLSHQLTERADRAERVDRDQREVAENQLSTTLARIDIEDLRPQLVAELADAEARVLIARRFHNDAVRDTLAIRTRPMVRLLHLGGRAPLPLYFEITERVKPSAATGLPVEANRTSARVVLFDEEGRALLVRGHDPLVPKVKFWFTLGGGVKPGENLRAAAVREVFEETGRQLEVNDLVGPLWRRVAVFEWTGRLIRSEELFFAAATTSFTPSRQQFTDLEKVAITDFRWCVEDDIERLHKSGETVYPLELAELLPEARAAVRGEVEVEVRPIR